MSSQPLRILLVEDSPDDAERVLREIRGLGRSVVHVRVETEAAFRKALAGPDFDLVLAEYSLPRFSGMDALAILRERCPDVPLVIVTGNLDEETAVSCMKMGASDYVLKEHLFKLRPAVSGVLEKTRILQEKKSAESRLRESLRNLQAVVDTSPLAITALDLAGNVFLWNPAAERIYGWTEAETLGRMLPTLPEGEEEAYRGFLADFAREGGTRTWTDLRRRKSGELIQAKIHAALLRREDSGEPYGIMAVIEDETERIAAEAALAESERRFRAIFQGSKAIMILIDPDTGRLLDANPAALAFYGYSKKRFLSLRISQLNTLPEEEILAEMQRARSGARLHFDFRHRLADGKIRDVEIYSGPIEAGGKKLLFSVIHDVTDRHEAERALQVSQEDLRKSLERIRRSWEQTVEVLSGLVELRDPYTAGHQKGVARLARAIALRLGLEEERVRGVTLAATIHDVGKINVPAEILSKPGQLSQLEANLVRLHPQSGSEALKGIDVPWPLAEIVHQHHERMDGSGYPRGLKGGEILLEARIIAVADVVEAMCSHRPYRAAFGVPAALGEIRSGAGRLYDEPVVGACLSVFEEEGFRFEEPGKTEGRDT